MLTSRIAPCSREQMTRMHPIPMMRCEFATVRLPGRLALRSGRRSRPSPMTTTLLPPPAVAIKKPAANTVRCASSRREDAEFSCDGEFDGGRRWWTRGWPSCVDGSTRWRPRSAAGRSPPQDDQESAEWQEWYATYDADVWQCQLLGVLQTLLINSRPGVGVGTLAVGLVVVLVLAVPASAFVLVKLLLDASRAIISDNLHH